MHTDAFFLEVIMPKNKKPVCFSKPEIILWGSSVTVILLSFCAFDGENHLALSASLVGVTGLVFNAKGNPLGQLLMVLFSLLYGAISFVFAYYGEMLTYLGMTLPMSILAFISWLRNPHNGSRAEVRVNSIGRAESLLMWVATAVVTALLYHPLRHLGTANLVPSTLSVATSFLAVYLTFRRDPRFALAYAANDIVLIVLWVLASLSDARYISVVVCFVAFLVNDIYCYLSWQGMRRRQAKGSG